MGILDDTAIFAAVISQGGFSHAAKHLGLSNGLISRRISQLEKELGVTLIKRTTRQIHLTPEGQLYWQHAQRIQQELDSALSLIQSSTNKPKGRIRISAPPYFGRHYLLPLLMKFQTTFDDIQVDLILAAQKLDLIKEELDLVIRGAGYLESTTLKDSSIKMKLLLNEKIGLYASAEYLIKHHVPQSPEELKKHVVIGHVNNKRLPDNESWRYSYKNKSAEIELHPKLNSNDIESNVAACEAGFGIGRFTDTNVASALRQNKMVAVLPQYDWGSHHLFVMYSNQEALPKRTRLLLDFLVANVGGGIVR